MKAIINIDVDELAKGEAFYCAAFGLTVGRRMGEDFLELLGAPITICLIQKGAATADAFGGEATARTYARHWTPIHFDWCVDDLGLAIARAVGAGARVEGETREDPYGASSSSPIPSATASVSSSSTSAATTPSPPGERRALWATVT
jgi:predicted enzyme related to lactoylglutathione lyase